MEVAAFTTRLRTELREAGVFRNDDAGYWVRGLWVLIVTACVWIAFLSADAWAARAAVAILAGYIGVQSSAIAHEAGHGAVTRDRKWSWFVGRLFMSTIIGASYSAWIGRHGPHHVHPNSRKDPDVRPSLFSFNETDAIAAKGLAAWCTRKQHVLLIPLSTLMGFSLKIAGWKHVVRRPAAEWVDLTLLILHAAIWIVLPAFWIGIANSLLNYVLLTWVEGAYLAFVFLANHLGGPTSEEACAWPPSLRQIVTARNLPSNRLLTHLCIGLNTHIEHHLFGNLPATRLSEARNITRRICQSHGVPYRECTLGQAFAEVHRYNRRMADAARQAQRSRRSLACEAGG
ncbi:acyl-CoA desaturase [Variovorax sp. OAS795]|uniref:fatty acid desaturase family protein n=1 Tax=Variovorax sp. OAS795 TaxID=3034231 RepID=UPI00339390D1